MDIDEIRRANIRRLEHLHGPSLYKRAEMSPAQFYNLRDGAKDSKTGKPRGMRKETARRIEDAALVSHGYLDVRHDPDSFYWNFPSSGKLGGDIALAVSETDNPALLQRWKREIEANIAAIERQKATDGESSDPSLPKPIQATPMVAPSPLEVWPFTLFKVRDFMRLSEDYRRRIENEIAGELQRLQRSGGHTAVKEPTMQTGTHDN